MARLDFDRKNLPADIGASITMALVAVPQNVWDQLARTETFETIPKADVFKADETLGGSTKQAFLAAHAWINQPIGESHRQNG